MDKIRIKLKEKINKSYDIIIGKDIFNAVLNELRDYSKIAIITDSNVKGIYGNAFLEVLKAKGLNVIMLSFPAGEKSKNRETKDKIENLLLSKLYGRDSIIVALGGGVTGDLAGFIASTYMRGIPYIQIPTTLLAMVDSSLGGKTGVDTQYGKNTIGSYYQPKGVFADIDFLKTLPKEELLNGIAEMIKHAIISDEKYFDYLEANVSKLLSLDERGIVEKAVIRSIEIKRGIVEKDERDKNIRKMLNFGHTIGHAVEQVSNYSVPHGHAVAIGMIVEANIAFSLNLLKRDDLNRIMQMINLFGYKLQLGNLRVDKLVESTKMDKKNSDDKVNYTLPVRVGKVNLDIIPSEDIVRKILGEMN